MGDVELDEEFEARLESNMLGLDLAQPKLMSV
eukprot:CAMPEP_0170481852 /NCGR_PEP_ID=MMETSP0208-20121228/2135_1 /TAXON_ID=197538 /ORGANISM="Strombidium inclinatum, Strain S3" /LENGTH=31 /DNA_ID= /DNA_START= /DNA_END= /DNA_ORIENTATION=